MPGIDATMILRRLFEFYTLDEADNWLDQPHQLLGGRTPSSLIVEGRGSEVERLLDQLDNGVYP
jgi:uncharacterized protein (DUF2384 family)